MRTLLILTILCFFVSIPTYAQKNKGANSLGVKGTLSYPITHVTKIVSSAQKKGILEGPTSKSVVFYSDSSRQVSALYNGRVAKTLFVDSIWIIIINSENIFIIYANLASPIVKTGDQVKAGQAISNLAKDLDDLYSVEIYCYDNKEEIDLYPWFKKEKLPITVH